jgi:hypothetical protein
MPTASERVKTLFDPPRSSLLFQGSLRLAVKVKLKPLKSLIAHSYQAVFSLTQTGVGIVLLAIGAFLSSKSAMVLASCVFTIAAYRAGLLNHTERWKRVPFYVGIPAAIAIILVCTWTAAWKAKAMADARSTTSGVGPIESSQPAQVFESATRAPANLPAPVSQQLLLSQKPTRQKSHAGYGVRNSMVSDTGSNGGKFAIYNGGYTDQIDYKNV